MNCIVISLGGLNVGYLGCYGSAWVETPHLDRFAAEGFVFDQCFCDSPCPELARRAWWTARHQFIRAVGDDVETTDPKDSLIMSLRLSGVRTILIRDSWELLAGRDGGSASFERVVDVPRQPTSMKHPVFEAAEKWLHHEAGTGRYLLFLDCHGAHPSSKPDIDAYREPYAATVLHIDRQLGAFIDYLRQSGRWGDSLILVASDCGTPLGKPGIGKIGLHLSEEQVHVPLLLHMPSAHDAASRSQALVQTVDLMPTIFDALGIPISSEIHGSSLLPIVRFERPEARKYACMGIPGREWALRTAQWHLVLPVETPDLEHPTGPRLYVKPDDRWECNNTANQFPDVVEQMERTLRQLGVL